jgi:hypothetical protein
MDSVALKECAVCHLEKPTLDFGPNERGDGGRCNKCALLLEELLEGVLEEGEVVEEVKDEKYEPELLVATCSLCRARKDTKLFTKGKTGSSKMYCDVCAGKLVR